MTIMLKCLCLFENKENINLIWSGLIPGRNKEATSLGSRMLVTVKLLSMVRMAVSPEPKLWDVKLTNTAVIKRRVVSY